MRENDGERETPPVSREVLLTAQQSRIRDSLVPIAVCGAIITFVVLLQNFLIYGSFRPAFSTFSEFISCIFFALFAWRWHKHRPSAQFAPHLVTLLLILGQTCVVAEVMDDPDIRQTAYFSIIVVAMGSLVLVPRWLAINIAINVFMWWLSIATFLVDPDWIFYGMFHTVAITLGILIGTSRIGTVRHLSEVRAREDAQRRDLAAARDELALADDRFQSLLGAVDDIVWASSLDSKELYFISPAIERLTGKSLDTFYKEPGTWLRLVHPDDQARIREWSKQAAESFQSEAEYRIIGDEGELRWIQDRRQLIHDALGVPVRLGGIARDITERKLIQEEIVRGRARMIHTQKIAKVGSWEWNPETNEVEWSEGMFDIFGIQPGEFDGTLESALNLVHAEDRMMVALSAERSVSSGEAEPLEYRGIRSDGTIRHLWAVGKFVANAEGKIVAMFGSVQDITLRKRAEAERRALETRLMQAQKQESLGALAGGIAHDFNNMLMGILGNVSVARLLAADDAALQTPLSHIERSAERAAQMSRQMLTYSGRVVLRRTPTNLNSIVASVRADTARLAGEHIRIEYDTNPSLPLCNIDEKEVQQGVLNLLLNAIEALDYSEGHVTVRTRLFHLEEEALREMFHGTDAQPGVFVGVEIEDDGHGIAADIIPRLFDPFFTSKGMGRGLGLASVLGIARSHGGAIAVTSVPGTGACFRLMFPVVTQNGEKSASPARANVSASEGRFVLVIDDEVALLESVNMMLEHLGHPSVTAASGKDGLERYRDRKDDIGMVILDLTMPGMTGREVLKALRQVAPELCVVMSSGYPEDCDALLEADPRLSFLQKPYRMHDLEEVVTAHLGKPDRNSAPQVN